MIKISILCYITTFIQYILSYNLKNKLEPPYKIVLCSLTGSRSHVKGFLHVGQKLHDLGHNFTLLTTPNRSNWVKGHNFTSISIGEDEEKPLFKRLIEYEDEYGYKNVDAFLVHDLENMYIKPYRSSFNQIIDYIDNENPDLMICDFSAYSCIDAANSRAVPLIIGYQSIDFGNPHENSYITHILEYGELSSLEMNFFQRLYHFFYVPTRKLSLYIPTINTLKKLKNDFKIPHTIKTLRYDLSKALILINSFSGFDVPRLLPDNIQYIGPIIPEVENKKLDSKLLDFIKDKEKIVYISFGTNMVLKNNQIRIILNELIRCLQEKIIDGVVWSLTNSDFDSEKVDSKSILFVKYCDQNALLNHPSLKLFITHAGLESLFESMMAKVPILSIPFYFDQPRNAKKAENLNVARTLLKDKLNTPGELYSIIKEMIIEEKKYASSLKMVHKLIEYQRLTLNQIASKIIDYIELAKLCRSPSDKSYYKDPGYIPCELKYLTSHSDRMPNYKLYHLDIYFTFLGIGYLLFKVFIYLFNLKKLKVKKE